MHSSRRRSRRMSSQTRRARPPRQSGTPCLLRPRRRPPCSTPETRMNEPLRPSNLGEILDRTVHFYRTRFLVFFGIAVAPTAVVLVLRSGFFFCFSWWGSSGGPRYPAAPVLAVVFLCAIVLVALPIYLAATALASAAMNHAVARAYLGEKTTIREAYKTIWGRRWRYLWLYLLEDLILWVAPAAVCVGLLVGSAGAAAMAIRTGMSVSSGTLIGLATFMVFAALGGYVLWM